MTILKKVTLISIILIISIIIFITMFIYRDKSASGIIYDCLTNEPISGVNVSLNDRGWGISDEGRLIWDKDYVYKSTSDANGFFQIYYKKRPTQIIATKKGYLPAHQWEAPSNNITIKLHREDFNNHDVKEVTYYCKLSSDCSKKRTNESGVVVSENICKEY